MKNFLLLLLCLFTFKASGQFFYTASSPDSKYLISDVTNQVSTGENVGINVIDQSFSIAAWVDVSEYNCNGVAFGTDEIKVSILKSQDKYKVRFSLKDSLVVEGSDFNDLTTSDLLTNAFINSHIVVTYNGSGTQSGMKIYINGALITNNSVTNLGGVTLTESEIKIGGASCDLKYYNISSYNYDLSQSQVNTLYAAVDAKIGVPYTYITGSEKYKQSGFLNNVFQKWEIPSSGKVLSIPAWGDEANSALDYRSPIGGGVFNTPFILYNSDQNKSYIATISRGGPGFARGYYMTSFDHSNNIFQIENKIDGASPLIQDYHHTSRIALGKDSSLIHFSEKEHNGDLYIYKKTNYNGEFLKVDSITGGQLAYAQPIYLGSNLFIIGRKNFQSNTIYKSTDDGETWGGENVVSQMETNDWAYFSTWPFGDSIAYLGIINRNYSAGGEYNKLFLLKTTDGENFCNVSGSVCENITTGLWDIDELRANAAIDSTTNGSSSVMYEQVLLDTAGRTHIIYSNNESSLLIHAMYDDGWSYDTIENPRISEFTLMLFKGGDTFDLFLVQPEGETEKIVKKTTTDNFHSFSAEETLFVNNYSNEGRLIINITQNQSIGKPVILATSLNIDGVRQQSALWIYKYNPWE
jgi:hypothetical protein